MSILYLIRHGQAGTRDNYDSLSELGREQARLLGAHLRQVPFEAVYCGSLARQRATALEALPDASPLVDPGWDEFDLDQVYREYAPLLCRHDPQFRREFDQMQREIEQSQGAADAPIHRKWNHCDRECVRAWIESRYEYSGETWPMFLDRVHNALDRLLRSAPEGNVAVFTSATPIGIASARALEIADHRAMWLAGVMFNTAVTTIRLNAGEARLFTFNGTAHLTEAHHRTFR